MTFLKSAQALSLFFPCISFSNLCKCSSSSKLLRSLATLFFTEAMASCPSACNMAVAFSSSSNSFLRECSLRSMSSMTERMLSSLQQVAKQVRFWWQSLALSLSNLSWYSVCICFSRQASSASRASLLTESRLFYLPAILSSKLLHSSIMAYTLRCKSQSEVAIPSGSMSSTSCSTFSSIWICSQCSLLLSSFSLRLRCVIFSLSYRSSPCFWFLFAMISVSRLTFSPTYCKLRSYSKMFQVAAYSRSILLDKETIQLSCTATALSNSLSIFSSLQLSFSSCSLRSTSTRMSSSNDLILASSLQSSSWGRERGLVSAPVFLGKILWREEQRVGTCLALYRIIYPN